MSDKILSIHVNVYEEFVITLKMLITLNGRANSIHQVVYTVWFWTFTENKKTPKLYNGYIR